MTQVLYMKDALPHVLIWWMVCTPLKSPENSLLHAFRKMSILSLSRKTTHGRWIITFSVIFTNHPIVALRAVSLPTAIYYLLKYILECLILTNFFSQLMNYMAESMASRLPLNMKGHSVSRSYAYENTAWDLASKLWPWLCIWSMPSLMFIFYERFVHHWRARKIPCCMHSEKYPFCLYGDNTREVNNNF